MTASRSSMALALTRARTAAKSFMIIFFFWLNSEYYNFVKQHHLYDSWGEKDSRWRTCVAEPRDSNRAPKLPRERFSLKKIRSCLVLVFFPAKRKIYWKWISCKVIVGRCDNIIKTQKKFKPIYRKVYYLPYIILIYTVYYTVYILRWQSYI